MPPRPPPSGLLLGPPGGSSLHSAPCSNCPAAGQNPVGSGSPRVAPPPGGLPHLEPGPLEPLEPPLEAVQKGKLACSLVADVGPSGNYLSCRRAGLLCGRTSARTRARTPAKDPGQGPVLRNRAARPAKSDSEGKQSKEFQFAVWTAEGIPAFSGTATLSHPPRAVWTASCVRLSGKGYQAKGQKHRPCAPGGLKKNKMHTSVSLWRCAVLYITLCANVCPFREFVRPTAEGPTHTGRPDPAAAEVNLA